MNTIYLLLGSNQGNREMYLDRARQLITEKLGPIIQESSIYETAPWGNITQDFFLNKVIIIHTKLDADKTLEAILNIESDLGRKRTIKNASRIIDIDILFFNELIINKPDLIIPHPEIQNRMFVLVPLVELNADLVHPVSRLSVGELIKICPDKLAVEKFSTIDS